MRILVDENTAVQILDALRHLLPKHKVDHVTELKWSGKKDVQVLLDASGKGYDVFLTKDGRQLDDPDETDAIKRASIHHVRYSQKEKGLTGLGLAMGAILAAMPLIVRELEEAKGQRIVHVRGLSPTSHQRFESVDPRRAPPKYWR